MYDNTNMYNPTRNIAGVPPVTSMCGVSGLLVVGSDSGAVSVLSPLTGAVLQRFSDHKAAVTGLYAVSHVPYSPE